MNLSAILVVVSPGQLDTTIPALEEMPGVSVHHTERPQGRMIVVQEAATIGEEVDGLKRIQALPHVMLAEMVEHHFAQDTEILDAVPEDLPEGLALVPQFLADDPDR